ncbi:MAG: NAD(P)/FAD-dependent oxidoreductase [Acidimicrobiales bacterium]
MIRAGSPDVVVVGGGAVGVMAAYELARRGAQPVLLERAADLLSSCSSGSAGLLSPAHSAPLSTPQAFRQGVRYMFKRDSPFSMRPRPDLVPWLVRFMAACRADRVGPATELLRDLSIASLAIHEALATDGLDTGYERLGALNIYETESAYAGGRIEAEQLDLVGIKSQVLTAGEACELEPALNGGLVGGVFYPDEAHCEPERFMLAVAEAAVAAGAEIHTKVEVLGIRRDGDRAVALDTTAGELRPRTVVLANGAAVARFRRQLRVPIPVEGGKGYHVDLKKASGDPAIPIYMQEARVIATPFANRLRLAGTLQLTGLDPSVDQVRVQSTLDAGMRTLNNIDSARVIDVWRGIRPCTPDGLPIIGCSERLANVVFATGHGMKGLHLAPETGRVVAQLITGESPSRDLAPFSPDRFRSTVPLGSRGRADEVETAEARD